MQPDEEVRPARWSTTSWLGRSWSLLLRWFKVSNLSRFWLARWLGGAADPLGVAGPPLGRGMNCLCPVTLRMVLEWRLWRLIGRRGGPIDPSDHNFIHSIELTLPWSISFMQVVHAGIGTEDVARGRCGCTWQGWSCLVVRACLARVACWSPPPPECVLIHENCNTTRGTLLVPKMCMKLVVYSSRTWGFDGWNFVVRTINKHPQAKRLLILEQSLDLA
jgi:hypothetical protein